MILRVTSPEENDDVCWEIEADGKVFDGLSWDEMLGRLAALTIPRQLPERFRSHMRTPREFAERRQGIRTREPS